MTTIITVTEMASMPGRFCCDHKTGTGRTYSTTHAGKDPEGAAAYAMSIALGVRGSYVILGPKKVLGCIPAELRLRSGVMAEALFGDPDEVADLIPSTESNPGSDFYKQEAKQALNTVIAALQTAKMAYSMIDLTVLLMSDGALLELESKLSLAAPDSEESKAYSLFLDKFRIVPTQHNQNATGIDMKKLKDVFGSPCNRLAASNQK